jgi:hypothetical protein
MQATHFELFALYLWPCRAKDTGQKKRSTMLPQAKGTVCVSPIVQGIGCFVKGLLCEEITHKLIHIGLERP